VYSSVENWTPYAVRDGNLVSGKLKECPCNATHNAPPHGPGLIFGSLLNPTSAFILTLSPSRRSSCCVLYPTSFIVTIPLSLVTDHWSKP
jgi:hypothetical protein